MKKVLKIIGWTLGILIVLAVVAWFGFLKPKPPPVSEADRADLTLMPLPAELKLGNGVFVLSESLSHEFIGESGARLERAVDRFYTKLSDRSGMAIGSGTERTLVLHCLQYSEDYPSLEDDESYSIKITSGKILVEAQSGTGILYALESLLQLATEENGSWVLPRLSMNDTPRFPWRGLMIDVCRHWIPKEVILRNLEAMGALKMNVLHLHLTEAQGFRIESHKFPRLHQMGSEGKYFSQDDIREIIAYATDRGIRVVPEFDVPGHTKAWFVGHPELASAPGPYQLDSSMMGVQPAMDPTRDEIYSFLEILLGEMSLLFPDQYLHIGGDEVHPTHWNENPDIQAFMKDHNLKDPHDLQAYFNLRLQKIVAAQGKSMLGWDEILHPDLPQEGIAVQTWRNQEALWESARKGYQAINSAGYYLDHKQTAAYHYQVDPTIIPGAVNIEIDSSQWKAWDCTIKIAEMEMDGALYLFGEGEEMRGIMDFMGGAMGFTKASLEGDQFLYTVESPMGDLEYITTLAGDSLYGSSKISVFTMELSGRRSGGSDMVGGAPLPEFKKIEPLTPEQESRLIGGEACMWTEMANEHTLDSRIWPRAAAIGEKLWSPAALTDNIEDMYRRLMIMNLSLSELGLTHESYRASILADMVEEQYLEALNILASVLQEEKLFGRMAIYGPMYYLTTPLNRMVDAAAPESYQAYLFGEDVKLWIESEDTEARERLELLLKSWSVNHEKLLPAFEGNERLMEVEAHSRNLSVLATLGLDALEDPASLLETEAMREEFFKAAGEANGGCNLALVEAVQKLVESAAKK